MIYISSIIGIIYCTLLFLYKKWWKRVPVFSSLSVEENKPNFISVLIPARNEETSIGDLLYSLSKQSFPADLFEVIVINDHSEDNTVAVARTFASRLKNMKIIQLSDFLNGEKINSYKKKAIEAGVSQSAGDIIISTDADCIVPPDWIETIVSFYTQNKAALIVAPVKMQMPVGNSFSDNLLYALQILDFSTLQGITGAALSRKFHYMANGANLTYEKEAFEQVRGYESVDRVASGDDMFLLEKIRKRFPARVEYLKSLSATVTTFPEPTFSSFINQRIRWASKSAAYKDWKIKSVLLVVYLANIWSIVLLATCFYISPWWLFVVYVLVKVIFEYSFLAAVMKFFRMGKIMKWFLLTKPVHCGYIVLAGALGFAGKYRWKDRKVR